MSARRWNSQLGARFEHAREALGVQPGASASEIKAAYRRMIARFPPDRDAERFGAIRAAYELLADPIDAAEHLLVTPIPFVDPFEFPEIPKLGALTRRVLEDAIGRLPAELIGGFDDE
ncbi:MAG: DnaJ domain-containing protein [Deltaproteobacteria bacterium]|nr:DnaJ domain-containing protein [Deltaproteobacteria bacterium]